VRGAANKGKRSSDEIKGGTPPSAFPAEVVLVVTGDMLMFNISLITSVSRAALGVSTGKARQGQVKQK